MMLPERQRRGGDGRDRGLGLRGRVRRRDERAAADLGSRRTSYANPIGLDDPFNYSTAADLADLTLRAARGPDASARSSRCPRRPCAADRWSASSSPATRCCCADPSVDGVKTGHTTEAGYVLVASAKREGVPLVSVVLGAASEAARDAETAELLDYGYSLYDERSAFRREARSSRRATVSYEDAPLALLREARAAGRRPRGPGAGRRASTRPSIVEGPIDRGRADRHGDGDRSTASVVGAVPLRRGQRDRGADLGRPDRRAPGWWRASSPSRSSYFSLPRSCFGTARGGRRRRARRRA